MKLFKIALLAGLFSGQALAEQPPARGITIEDIATIQKVSAVKVAPDGDKVAFTRSVPRELYVEKNGLNWSELFIVDDKGVERPYITGQVNIKNLSWSADGQYIYFLSKLNGNKYQSLNRIPFKGGEAQLVLELKGRSISNYQISPNGQFLAYLAKPAKDKAEDKLKKLGFKAEVYEEGLKNQQLFVVPFTGEVKEDTAAWDISGYVSAINWSADSDKLLVKTQPTALIDDRLMKSTWHIADRASQKVTLSFATEGKLGAAEFSHDGQYVAILGAEDKHDPAVGRLYLANTETGNISEWLPDFNGHINDIEWANNSNQLYFSAHLGTDTLIGKIKTNSKKYKTAVAPGKFIAGHLSISDSDKTIALKANSAQHPDEVYMLRGKAHKATRLTESNEWINERPLAKQETIKLKARDGLEIAGVLVYPLNYEEGQRYPLIMSVHGGPEAHDKDGWITNYSRPGQMAAAKGYAVFYPNYRGSTGKGVEFSKLGQADYAGKEFDDLVDFKNHLVAMGLVDEKKVGITGGSYGGYASAWAATKLTEHFAASVMFVGISNQLSKFGTTDISNEMNLVHARSYPWEKWQWYLERSPIYWAHQSKTPLLIMHGKDDPRVHPAQSMEMYRYMKVQGKQVRLVYYPGEPHGNKRVASQYDYSIRLMRWMDNYLLEGNDAMPDYKIDHKKNMDAAKK